jgi:hypothetical protein
MMKKMVMMMIHLPELPTDFLIGESTAWMRRKLNLLTVWALISLIGITHMFQQLSQLTLPLPLPHSLPLLILGRLAGVISVRVSSPTYVKMLLIIPSSHSSRSFENWPWR